MGTAGVGSCASGTQECAAGAWGTCNGEVVPTVEICNSADDDCDGVVNDGLTFVNYYVDGDNDGFGAGAATNSCTAVSGSVTNNTDCDDSNAAINTNATDASCDGIDQNCSGGNDEGYVSIACDGTDTDLCTDGMTSCVSGTVTCNDNASSVAEILQHN